MKKAAQILTAAILSLGLASIAHTAGAQQPSCDSIVITNTGAGSNNQGVCTVNVTATVICSNNVYVLDNNSQQAVSGAASVLGNTTASTAVSGDATNQNGTAVQIGAACVSAVTPTTPTPETPAPQTPTTPTVTPIATAPAAKPAVLPYTAGNSTIDTILIAAILLGTIAITIRLAISAYRRFHVAS